MGTHLPTDLLDELLNDINSFTLCWRISVCCIQGGKNMENSKRKIFIGGLPANITETQLKDHFIKYGNVCNSCFNSTSSYNQQLLYSNVNCR